jgi:hypothetical protein
MSKQDDRLPAARFIYYSLGLNLVSWGMSNVGVERMKWVCLYCIVLYGYEYHMGNAMHTMHVML